MDCIPLQSPKYRLTLIGGFRLERDGELHNRFYSDKVRALLVYLAAEGSQPVRRTVFCQLLWPRYRKASAQANLRKALYELKKLLKGASFLKTSHQAIWLEQDSEDFSCDLWDIRNGMEEIRSHEHSSMHRCPSCKGLLTKLKERVKDGLCPGLEMEDEEGFDLWKQTLYERLLLDVQTLEDSLEVGLSLPTVGNIPLKLGAFIGREEELCKLSRVIEEVPHSLISILGVGGVGKTELALALGRRLYGHYPDGVWVCSIDCEESKYRSELPIEQQLYGAIARAIGMGTDDIGVTGEGLILRLGSRRQLLILDEIECLLGANKTEKVCSGILNLMERCSGITLVLTSRMALNIEVENRLILGGLANTDENDIAGSMEGTAVALFLSVRCRALNLPTVTPDDLRLISEICHRLEGHPLAVKMAASLSQRRTLAAVAEVVTAVPLSLSEAYQDSPARHRRLKELFIGCVGDLPEESQLLLVILALLQGPIRWQDVKGFIEYALEREVAQSVLDDLIDWGLVHPIGEDCLHLHRLLRQSIIGGGEVSLPGGTLSLEQCAALDEAYRHYFVGRLKKIKTPLFYKDVAIRKSTRGIWPELRHAWLESLKAGEYSDLVKGGMGLKCIALEQGENQEAIKLLKSLSEKLGRNKETRGGAEHRWAMLLLARTYGDGGHFEAGRELLSGLDPTMMGPMERYNYALVTARTELVFGEIDKGFDRLDRLIFSFQSDDMDENYIKAEALCLRGGWASRLGRCDAQEGLNEALLISQTYLFPYLEAQALINLAGSYFAQDRMALMWERLEAARRVVEAHELDILRLPVLHSLSLTYRSIGNIEVALQMNQLAAEESKRVGQIRGVVHSKIMLSSLCLDQEKIPMALAAAREALSVTRLSPMPVLESRTKSLMSVIYYCLADARCLAYAAEARALAESANYWPIQCDSDALSLSWSLYEEDLPAIRLGVEKMMAWIEEHPNLPGCDSLDGYRVCYQGLLALKSPRSEDTLFTAVELLKQRLKTLPTEENRRAILLNQRDARLLYGLLTSLYGKKTDSLLGLSAPTASKRESEASFLLMPQPAEGLEHLS